MALTTRLLAADPSGLLQLQSTATRSAWRFGIDEPTRTVAPVHNHDSARKIVEQNSAREFAFVGGASADRVVEIVPWKVVFVRRRVAQAKTMIKSALDGTLRKGGGGAGGSDMHVRKKDLPDPNDKVGIRRLLSAQALQETLVQRRLGRKRARRVVAVAARALAENRLVWSAPEQEALGPERRRGVLAAGGDLEAIDRPTRRPRQRVVLDGLASARECALTIGLAVCGMDSTEGESHGESVLIASPPTELRDELGEGAARLVALLCWRVQTAIRVEFGEERPLLLAGAMLTRLQPPAAAPGSGGSGGRPSAAALAAAGSAAAPDYSYSVAHVDRANVSSYDYSSVLYLNSKGTGFEGGDFAFVDDDADEVVEPRGGRLLLFTSGYEHLHRVGTVTSGSRFVLASWFTLSATAGDALSPAHYDVRDVAPPPTDDEAEAEKVKLDDLQRRLDEEIMRRQMGGARR